MKLQNNICIVTGALSGNIGKAIAARFARECGKGAVVDQPVNAGTVLGHVAGGVISKACADALEGNQTESNARFWVRAADDADRESEKGNGRHNVGHFSLL